MNILRRQQGVSLLLVLMVLSILLAIGAGIAKVLIVQFQIQTDIGKSVVAFYAGDSGVERALRNRNNDPALRSSPPAGIDGAEWNFPNGASYKINVSQGSRSPSPDLVKCPNDPVTGKAFYYCIESIGKYQGVSRTIEIKY